MTMTYEEALTAWGRKRLRVQAEEELRWSADATRRFGFGPKSVRQREADGLERQIADRLALIDRSPVSVSFMFDEGYACCGGQDPDCYCSFAESPSASVRIEGAGVTVDIDADGFDFVKVLGEIVAEGGGEIRDIEEER